MHQIYISAMDAMKAARYFSYLLRRPVVRYMVLNKCGVPLWVVSVNNASQSTL